MRDQVSVAVGRVSGGGAGRGGNRVELGIELALIYHNYPWVNFSPDYHKWEAPRRAKVGEFFGRSVYVCDCIRGFWGYFEGGYIGLALPKTDST